MKTADFIKENIVTDAQTAHVDHEVQMARSDCFHAAEDALMLHRILRDIPEAAGLEGWVAAKITLAADYLNTVRDYLEYQRVTGDVWPKNADMTTDMTIVSETARVSKSSKRLGKHPEPNLPESAEEKEDSPVARATLRRIMMRHPGMLAQHGPERVMAAVNDVADLVGDMDDIGTSDISGWVNMVQEILDSWDQNELQEGPVVEMSAGSIATVVNPTAKNKSKVGTLFGGTYKQKTSSKAKK